MRWLLLIAIVFLLSACSFFQIEVPPDAYSVETALQILENQEYRLVDIKEVDQYRDVEMKGKVAIFESKQEMFCFFMRTGEKMPSRCGRR